MGRIWAALLAAIVAAGSARAASLTIILDESNTLADGVDYLSVLMEDGATPNTVDFTVETLAALDSIAGSNYGIQEFGLSLVSGSATVSGLPGGWSVQENKNMSEFGTFDFRLKGTGSSRVDTLMFTLTGVSLADIDPFFAAHVAGFDAGNGVTSAFFGGDKEGGPPQAVPVPAAGWLFATGLVGLLGGRVARRRIDPEPSVRGSISRESGSTEPGN